MAPRDAWSLSSRHIASQVCVSSIFVYHQVVIIADRIRSFQNGQRAEDEEDVLQRQVWQTHLTQGDTIQERQGMCPQSGTSSVRSQATWLRWAVEADFQEESQNHQENCPSNGMYRMQESKTIAH